MSADGQSLTYVFSGEDSFSIRQATLMLKKTTRTTLPGKASFSSNVGPAVNSHNPKKQPAP